MPDGDRSFSMEAVNGEAIIGDNNYLFRPFSRRVFIQYDKGWASIRNEKTQRESDVLFLFLLSNCASWLSTKNEQLTVASAFVTMFEANIYPQHNTIWNNHIPHVSELRLILYGGSLPAMFFGFYQRPADHMAKNGRSNPSKGHHQVGGNIPQTYGTFDHGGIPLPSANAVPLVPSKNSPEISRYWYYQYKLINLQLILCQ